MAVPTDAGARAPWRFDEFVPGATLGSRTQTLDEPLLRALRAVYGPGEGGPMRRPEAAALAMVLMMRAYMAVVAPRPPGNIHARQRLRIQALPTTGESLSVVLRCHAKELRRGRRYVDFEAVGTGAGGRALFTGLLTLVWAA